MSAYKSNIIDLLKNRELAIPDYQRPYKWEERNVQELLTDISHAIEESKKYPVGDYKYRIGTILLHDDKNASKYIVDGQQRLITAGLICLALGETISGGIFSCKFTNSITKKNLKDNYLSIRQWFSLKSPEERASFLKAFSEIIEVVVIEVTELSEAFQLFDSQNSRGKSLNPHDILKAYHLREMHSNVYEMERAVKEWEDNKPSDIKELFDKYLFRIIKWSRSESSSSFTDKQIDQFKGVDLNLSYTYALRAFKASPCFQINEPFIAGKDFFMYVDHYLHLKKDIERHLETCYNTLWKILWDKQFSRSSGFCHARNLFFVVLLCYYDKFHMLDKVGVYRLFTWAMMIRVDMNHLGQDSINRYALGKDGSYTNHIPMFSKIVNARKHTDISNLKVECRHLKVECRQIDKGWTKLGSTLVNINCI